MRRTRETHSFDPTGNMPQDNDQQPPRSLGLSPAQIAGSALSAVSAAFVASWAGTTGTLIGAAVGSVVATIGAAFYTSSLKRSSEAVRRAATQVRQTSLLTGTLPRTVVSAQAGPTTADPVTAGDESVEPRSWRDRLPWTKVLVASLAITVVALGGITAVEAVTGRPLSSWLGGDDSQGTTVGHVIGSDSSSSKDTGTDNSDTGTTKQDDATTPSQDTQPSSPVVPQTSTGPSQAPSQAPSVVPDPAASTAP